MHDLTPKKKRMARIVALQVIYAQEFQGSDIDNTFKHMLDPNEIPEEAVIAYSRHLCVLTMTHKNNVDSMIKKRLKKTIRW